jgi:hypothetical protein
VAAIHGVAADGQRFYQGELLERKFGRGMKLSRRNDEVRPQTTIGMNTKHLDRFTTITIAAPARGTFLAIDVRLDGASFAWFHICDTWSYGNDFDTQFVTRNAWVTVKRHLAEVPRIVAAADADAVDSHEGLTCLGLIRFSDIDLTKMERLFELDSFHAN